MEGYTASQPYQPKSIGMLLTIVGTRHYTAPEKLDDYLKEVPGHQMMIMAEPQNKYDPLAVKVLDCQDGMRLIGYISSQETQEGALPDETAPRHTNLSTCRGTSARVQYLAHGLSRHKW